MTFHVRLSARAYIDIDEILEWISPRAPLTAARWHDSLLKAIESLDQNPQRYGVAEESETLGFEVRQFLFGKRQNV